MQREISRGFSGILSKGLAFVMVPVLATSCMTTYDAYGNPQQSVDPGMATAGVVAAGLIGYALANDSDNNNYYGSSGHHGGGYGYGGGYRRSYSGYGGGYGYGGYGGGSCY